MKLSIVIPAYNEEESIKETIVNLHQCLENRNINQGTDSYNSKTMVVLISKKDTLFFDTYQHLRPDVTAAKKSTDLNESGFSFFVPIKLIPKGNYSIGFLIIKTRDFPIEIKRSFELTPIVIENRGKMIVKSFSSELRVNYHFDDVTWENDSLKLRGWYYIEGIKSSDSGLEFMIQDKTGRGNLFKPVGQNRPDVSAAFHGDYDSSGFKVRLPFAKDRSNTKEIYLLAHSSVGKKKINITNVLRAK